MADIRRFLVLTTDAYGGHGGIALYNRDMLAALCALPCCNEVVAVPRLMPFAPENILPENLTFVTSGLNSKGKYLIAVLKVMLSNPRFDVVICGHVNLLPIAYLVSRWIRKPLLLLVYGIDVWRPTNSRLTNFLVGKISHYFSISRHTESKFKNWAKIDDVSGSILPNAIHLSWYGIGKKNQELIDRYGLHGKSVIMTLGRLVSKERSKGFDEVLELMPELIADVPSLAYLIVGKGPDKQRLQEKAKRIGVEASVVFTGFIPDTEKADHYRLADAYVMPSLGEGFGFVFLEAMACGVPVVASRLDGGVEATRNGLLGELVNPNDPCDIKRGILCALKKERCIPNEMRYFSYSEFEKRVHLLINRVLEESR
jgi:glycosyltransferase involved in cell wall biosynthesis